MSRSSEFVRTRSKAFLRSELDSAVRRSAAGSLLANSCVSILDEGLSGAAPPFVSRRSLRGSRRWRTVWLGIAISVVAAASRAQEPAARLDVHRLDGRAFSLASLKGHVVVLDFWASWCVPCRTSVPFLNGLQQKYGPQGLEVVGLTLEEDGDAVSDFLDAVPAAFLIVRDPSGRAGEVFAVEAMPTSFLIDRQGHVAARFEGSDKNVHARLEAAAKTLLEGGSLAPGTDIRVSKGLQATGSVKAWQRGYLADPIMSLQGSAASQIFKEHIHASKEGAAGDGGPSGGGCGCN